MHIKFELKANIIKILLIVFAKNFYELHCNTVIWRQIQVSKIHFIAMIGQLTASNELAVEGPDHSVQKGTLMQQHF